MTYISSKVPCFSELGITPILLASLERKFSQPTPIQHLVIPAAIAGKDVVGIAQTGTGKTLAFGVPMLQRLAINQGQGLVLAPTRELAIQVDEMLQNIGRPLQLKTAVVIGGAPLPGQIQALRRNPHIVVATPGRLIDIMQQKYYSLSKVNIVVLDEADRMLDFGFLPQLKQILTLAPKNRQTLLFSATMPQTIAQIATKYMKLPLCLEVAPSGTTVAHTKQEVWFLHKEEKMQALDKLLSDIQGAILVFVRTKHGAKKIARSVRAMGQAAVEIHSNRSLSQRREAMAGFKSGKYRVLIATDIAARGIDVTNISLVINYDLPNNAEDYVHRIGRTGRAGKEGRAITFATSDERPNVRNIERLIRKSLSIEPLPTLPPRRTRKV